MYITLYEDTGRITQILAASNKTINNLPDYVLYIKGEYHWDEYYIVDNIPTLRPAQDTVIDNYTISNIPLGAIIYIDDITYKAYEDTTVELDLLPGTYNIKVHKFPYIDKEFTIEVTA
jgi:hypothetical protein